nr:TrkA C-terminal domain-containing protein [Paenibacillus oenotherae]
MATAFLSSKFNRSLERKFEVHELPIKDVLLLEESDYFVELPVGPDCSYIGQRMRDILPSDADLNLLFIKRGTINVRKKKYETALEAGDVLYLYGDKKEFDAFFAEEMEDQAPAIMTRGGGRT